MFVQVIQGNTSDPEGFRRQLDRWNEELRPGAIGFLGSTAGVAQDGTAIAVARFESAEAAGQNSERPEQGRWWAEMEKTFDGEVSFHDYEEIRLLHGGGSDDAGFVQIISGRATDKDRMNALEDKILDWFPNVRPDFIGSLLAWDGDRFTEVAYFESEAAARAGETRVAESDNAAQFQEWIDLCEDLTYIDITEPQMTS